MKKSLRGKRQKRGFTNSLYGLPEVLGTLVVCLYGTDPEKHSRSFELLTVI
jgi:hypothetical protein